MGKMHSGKSTFLAEVVKRKEPENRALSHYLLAEIKKHEN
jgi:hypothetical protein